MDRWMDDEDTPTIQHGARPGRVARLGMDGFVKAQGTALRAADKHTALELHSTHMLIAAALWCR